MFNAQALSVFILLVCFKRLRNIMLSVNSAAQLLQMFLSLQVVFLSVTVVASNADQTGKTTPIKATLSVLVLIFCV